MTTSSQLLLDSFDRVRDGVHAGVADLSAEQLAHRIAPDANSIGWLVWHLTRVQDDHVAEVAGLPQVWTDGGWAERFGLPFPDHATGYGQSSEEVAAVRGVSASLLAGYHDAVHKATTRYVETLTDGDLDRVVDQAWDPPVTLAVRLVSVIGDDLQHVGQAAFLHGLV